MSFMNKEYLNLYLGCNLNMDYFMTDSGSGGGSQRSSARGQRSAGRERVRPNLEEEGDQFQQTRQEVGKCCKIRPQTYDGYSALSTQHSIYLNGRILSMECDFCPTY